MSNLICNRCLSSNVERRGTREKAGETYARLFCRSCSKWSTAPLTYDNIPTFERDKKELTELLKATTYIITSAQNNTPLNTPFWKALNRYAEFKQAQLLVIPVLYRNPTSPEELVSEDAWWPPEVMPYLIENDMELGRGIRIMGDVRINATAVNPLTGFESITRGDSAIFGHAQIAMKTVATPQNRLPKILHTTGSVSRKNYSQSKAGKKGDFHHSSGAVIVEIDEDCFHLRSVVGDKKNEFYDINNHVTPRGIKQVKAIEGIVLGDEHEREICVETRRATFEGPDSIVQICRPKYIIRHDVTSAKSITHHHRLSPSKRYEKHRIAEDSLESELQAVAKHVEDTTPNFTTSVIISSNHHDHITRWLEEADWRAEPWNAKIYHEMWLGWLEAMDAGTTQFDPFAWWMKQHCKAKTYYLLRDYPFIVKDIHLSYHGDKGANGTRGSLTGFSKIGAKTVIGHTHSPGIEKGAYQIGTSSRLRLEYTSGPSSWMNTHCLIFPNGKRQLINVIDGRWRAEENAAR